MTAKQIENKEKEIYSRATALNNGDYCGCAKYFTEEDRKTLDEMHYRRMINSCLCYGEGYEIFDEKENHWGDYGYKCGVEKFGNDKAYAIWKEQKEFFETHTIVHNGVHTDFEGCTYNSIEWIEDVLPMSDFGKMKAYNKFGEPLSFTNYDIAMNEYGTEIEIAKVTPFQDEDGNWIFNWEKNAYRRLKPIWDMADDNWRYLMKMVCKKKKLDFPNWMK